MKKIVFAAALALVAVLMLGWSGAVHAGDYKKGLEAYEEGDYATAFDEFSQLAQNGDADAQNDLGWMYLQGQGVAQNDAEAVKWFRLASEQGLAVAQYNLGVMHESGRGVTQDFVLAHMWFDIAASFGNEGAGKQQDDLAKQMTPADISEAQKMAREWMEKHPHK